MIRKLILATSIVGALALVACTGGAPPLPLPGPSPTPTPTPITAQADVFIKYGAGGYGLSPAMGPGPGTFGDRMRSRFGGKVMIVGYYQWTDAVAAQMSATPLNTKLISFGDSCGASAGPYDAAAVTRNVDLIGGFQPSIYCGGGGGFTEPVPANVLNAIEVYNPSCISTGGLGCRLWTLASNFPAGRLTIVQRPDMHPGVNVDSENDMLDKMAAVMAVGAARKALSTPLNSKPVVLVRHKGERL